MPGTRLLAGPWVHKAPITAVPGPNVDDDLEHHAFFHQHLRGGEPATQHLAHVFVRRPTPPEPDLLTMNGHWVEVDEWPPARLQRAGVRRATGDAVDELPVRGDVGIAAWNSCAGGLPWGQPLDQRPDNAMSIAHDWPHHEEVMILGNGEVALQCDRRHRWGTSR